jgi:hypothetical protein
VFENRVPKRILRPKREEGSGGWGELHSEELHNLRFSLNIVTVITSRNMRWDGHVARIGKMKNVYKILVRKPEGKR